MSGEDVFVQRGQVAVNEETLAHRRTEEGFEQVESHLEAPIRIDNMNC